MGVPVPLATPLAPKLPASVPAKAPAKAALLPSKAAAPPPPVPAMPRVKKAGAKPSGKVKIFFQEKGYGFITLDNGNEVFFHISSLDAGVSVGKNDIVEVSTSEDRSGKTRANKVSLVKFTTDAPHLQKSQM